MTFIKVPPHNVRSDQPGITVAANRRSIYVNAAAMRCLGLGAAVRYAKVPVDLLYDEATRRASLTLNVAGSTRTHYLTKMDSGGRIECAGFVRATFGTKKGRPVDDGRWGVIRVPAAWDSRRRMLVFGTSLTLEAAS